MTDWPTKEKPGLAIIAPTGFGTFGIWWRNFEAMERRGGYSGPYKTEAEAIAGANDWAAHWECPVRVEVREEKPA